MEPLLASAERQYSPCETSNPNTADAAQADADFNAKQDGCIKVVMSP